MKSEEPSIVLPRWSRLQRIVFRFAVVYLVLYNLPFPLNAIPIPRYESAIPVRMAIRDWVTQPYEEAWNSVVVWAGRHLFGLDIAIRPGGSGDTTWNYVQVACMFGFSTCAALLWSLVDWKRPNYSRLHEWLRIYVRFALANTMIGYGIVKVIKTQFPFPDVDRLMVSYGESSPMRLLWTFMGASEAYNVFTGAGEMLGGLLLTTRRTTLLGALVSAGVFTHVVALNFCYDVPVKLFSLHLLVMALFLIGPALPWLTQAFVLGRRVASPGAVPLAHSKWIHRGLVALRTMFVIAAVGQGASGAHQMRQQFGDLAPKHPLSGYWEVEEFEADGQVRPPLTSDQDRWHHLSIGGRPQAGSYVVIQTMTNGRRLYSAALDDEKRSLALSQFSPPGSPPSRPAPVLAEFTYDRPEEDRLTLEGKLDGRQIKAKLRHVDPSQFLLMNRGFHWVNETPYNAAVPHTSTPAR